MIDRDVEVLSVERNAPGRAAQFARPFEPNRTLLARGSFRFRQTTRRSFVLRFSSAFSQNWRVRSLSAESGVGSMIVVVVTIVGASLFVSVFIEVST